MKKRLFYFAILMCFCICPVFAQAIQTNSGLEIEEEKYNQLVDIYGSNYVNFMTEEEYKLIITKDLSKVEKVAYVEKPSSLISPFTSYSTSYKTINLINNSGLVTVELKWKKDPKVRSYDVLAVRLYELNLGRIIAFKQFYIDNGTQLHRKHLIMVLENHSCYQLKTALNVL